MNEPICRGRRANPNFSPKSCLSSTSTQHVEIECTTSTGRYTEHKIIIRACSLWTSLNVFVREKTARFTARMAIAATVIESECWVISMMSFLNNRILSRSTHLHVGSANEHRS